MNRQTKEKHETAIMAERARDLFASWAAEEEAGYEGEVSWEEFKRSLDTERRSQRKLFPER